MTMTKWMSIFFALMLLTVFSIGCTGASKETKIRCPKCGAIFSIEEGTVEQQMKAGSGGM
jgi:outer membrane lipoprotein-sorting protein